MTGSRVSRFTTAAITSSLLVGCATIITVPRDLPRTRAELSAYGETSRYADVSAFLAKLDSLHLPLFVGSIGTSTEGRVIPFVGASRPLVRTPAEAKRLGKLVVYVQANIHAGEVEGKEALLALVRDLATSPKPNVLDSIVLIAVPIYNADGNERLAPQSVNRTEQNGPGMVGQRANGQGLDLNRDYVKAEAPETRASLRMFNDWDPDVFLDLHTTDGSYHGYALTYAPPLNPASFFGASYARDSMLPLLRSRMRMRHALETFDYGNFISEDTLTKGWATFDPRPRFGTNYVGLRGRIAILSEAFSHDSFDRRIRATYAFVSEVLSLAAERQREIRTLSTRADAEPRSWTRPATTQLIPVRSELVASRTEAVRAEVLERTRDTTGKDPGVADGIKRTGRFIPVAMPILDRFSPSLEIVPPGAYVLSPEDTAALRILRLHGIEILQLEHDRRLSVERFVIDSVITAPREFQGHHEVRVEGRWERTESMVSKGSYLIPTSQRLGVLAVYLLEPKSDDSLTTWNLFDMAIAPGKVFPVRRLMAEVPPAPVAH